MSGGVPVAASIDCGGVPPTDSTRRFDLGSPGKRYFIILFVYVLVSFVAGHFSGSLQGTDFPDFYTAARMVSAGQGHQLYDADLQRQYQGHYSGRVGTLYIHPPFEVLIYLLVAFLPLRQAYFLWSLLSLTFLAAATRQFVEEASFPWDWEIQFAASLIFVPVLLCLQQGQDSLLLLLLVVLGFVALRTERAFAAGCWLGLGLFKFQIVLPIMLVLLLATHKRTRRGLAKGFGVVGLALAGISAAICGISVFVDYPRFLLHLQAQPFAGIKEAAMANLRGLDYLIFRGHYKPWAIAALLLCCLAALFVSLRAWRQARSVAPGAGSRCSKTEFDSAFANTVLFALLVSYHLNPHDLSLLLLPIPLLLCITLTHRAQLMRGEKWMVISLIGILFLPPLHLGTISWGAYAMVGFPLLGLLIWSALRANWDLWPSAPSNPKSSGQTPSRAE